MPTDAELDRIGATRIVEGKLRGRLVRELNWNQITGLRGAWKNLPERDPRKAFVRALEAYIDSGRVPRTRPKEDFISGKAYFQPPLMTPEGPVPAPVEESFEEDTSTEPPFVPGQFHYQKPTC